MTGVQDFAVGVGRLTHGLVEAAEAEMSVGLGRIEFHGTAEELAKRGDFETAYIGMT